MRDYWPVGRADDKTAEARRAQLRRFMEARELKPSAWARAAGLKSDGVIRNFLSGASKTMTLDTISKLAAAEKVSVTDIFPGVEISPAAVASRAGNKFVPEITNAGVTSIPGMSAIETWPKDLPIKGHAKGGLEGFFLDQGDTHGMARRPPALVGINDAFAVYVHDDSMYPAFEPGQVVWINPHHPIAPENNVVIEMHDGQAFIKRLKRRTAKQIICMQWNPKKDVVYEASEVKRLYYVLWPYKFD